MAKQISSKRIIEAVKDLAISANTRLSADVVAALKSALRNEKSPLGKEVLKQLIQNAGIARSEALPICQDTGYAIIFLELGQEAKVQGNIYDAINEGVRLGYKEGYLRKSIVSGPFERKNTGTNTPADIITQIVTGNKIGITFMAKGGGSENVSALKMFTPNTDFKEIAKFVTDKIIEAGPNPCPPIIVGLGIGGTADKAVLLAKKALLRKVGENNKDKDIAKKEKTLLDEINSSGVGPSGLGGTVTALAANIETFPCHIASLPVALAVDCHAHRVARTII
jgi:fumarate hydratase subunit alpha